MGHKLCDNVRDPVHAGGEEVGRVGVVVPAEVGPAAPSPGNDQGDVPALWGALKNRGGGEDCKESLDGLRQNGDSGRNFAYFQPIFCLWYPISCFSTHMFTEFAYLCLFLLIFCLFSA